MERAKITKLFGEEWVDFMAPFVQSEEFPKIMNELKRLKTEESQVIYPEPANVFRCFKELPLSKVRIVLVGQDPYPQAGYANGLAFAHPKTLSLSPSITHMINAVEKDVYNGLQFDKGAFNPELTQWQEQGVLLLNSALTVKENTPGSHASIWNPFMQYFFKTMNVVRINMIYTFWGKQAQGYATYVGPFNNFVIYETHPASAAHNGSKIWPATTFSKINAIITGNRLGEHIKW